MPASILGLAVILQSKSEAHCHPCKSSGKMNRKTLTLIIGAGASKEVNLPDGWELKQKIVGLLDIRFGEAGLQQKTGDVHITHALREKVGGHGGHPDINPYLYAAWKIRDAMPQAISIDNFMDSHQGDEEIRLCGKLAIVRSILEAEKKSVIYVNPAKGKDRIDFRRTQSSWMSHFFRLLTENCTADQLGERLEQVGFVIFNYDRCVEHYLYNAIQNYYGLGQTEVAELLNGVTFYHPYGSVGPLPWQNRENAVEYGGGLNPKPLLEHAEKIKTFTEGANKKASEISEIRGLVDTSETLLFLGFAFHSLNMSLIAPKKKNGDDVNNKRNYATAFGVSKNDAEAISTEISGMRNGGRAEVRNDLKCVEIFSEYTRAISLL